LSIFEYNQIMATNNLIFHMQVKFVYAEVAFNFKVEGKIERAIFEYKYYPTDNSIEHLEISDILTRNYN
jgi:hypothetical protein